jgi:hypothetical protein
MDAFETSTTVQPLGDVRVVGVPFAPGTEVEVLISSKRKSAADFGEAWERICREIRSQPQIESLSDEQIQTEIDEFRAGR